MLCHIWCINNNPDSIIYPHQSLRVSWLMCHTLVVPGRRHVPVSVLCVYIQDIKLMTTVMAWKWAAMASAAPAITTMGSCLTHWSGDSHHKLQTGRRMYQANQPCPLTINPCLSAFLLPWLPPKQTSTSVHFIKFSSLDSGLNWAG